MSAVTKFEVASIYLFLKIFIVLLHLADHSLGSFVVLGELALQRPGQVVFQFFNKMSYLAEICSCEPLSTFETLLCQLHVVSSDELVVSKLDFALDVRYPLLDGVSLGLYKHKHLSILACVFLVYYQVSVRQLEVVDLDFKLVESSTLLLDLTVDDFANLTNLVGNLFKLFLESILKMISQSLDFVRDIHCLYFQLGNFVSEHFKLGLMISAKLRAVDQFFDILCLMKHALDVLRLMACNNLGRLLFFLSQMLPLDH